MRESDEVPLVEIMENKFQMASAEEDLDAALSRIEPGRAILLPVIRDRQLVGLLTSENIGEFYLIRQALCGGGGSRPPAPPVIRIPRMMPPPLPIRQPSSWFRLAPTCLTAGSQPTTN